ncbi:DNA/RNA helicase domain-containing protein [Methanobrevibacter sp.]|uniref:DNA/RNA helicase domain-containing protein n=1 Tax=Methanobrevibacter sp. TaxID=66852 RepID=UPI003869FCD8
MIVYEASKAEFVDSVFSGSITDEIYEMYQQKIGKSGKSQIMSWENSMQYMYRVLEDSEIPDDCGVAIEFTIPTTSKRIDFIITGLNQFQDDSVVIIELKQWSEAQKVEGKDGVVKTILGGGLRETTHPSYQVWSYASLIKNFNQTVEEDEIGLHPCAYLHNYDFIEEDPLTDEIYKPYFDEAPLYGKRDALKLRNFIKKYIRYGDNSDILLRIDNGKIRPSKKLQDTLASMLDGNKEFVMIDEQKICYELAIKMARESYLDDKKRVLIVEGGPGTGKSVVAINLLVDLMADDMLSLYVTKNSAPRNVFFEKLKGGKHSLSYLKNLFKGSGSFTASESNEFDAIIVDEAHRLNKKSGLFSNLGENQVKEIINAAKFSVFFIDKHQKISLKDYGSVEAIYEFCNYFDAEVEHIKLESQFRCNGSDGYLSWLNDVLEIEETANFDGFDFDYDFRVVDSPSELRDLIFEKNTDNNARLLAGYCWDWIKEGKNNTDVHDIVIDDFSMSWNLGNSDTWAIDEDSVNEIGCIHTSQGLEFDYVGVIIGEDMRFDGEHIVTDFEKRARTDQSLKGIKKMYKENSVGALEIADEIIKNTYRTLMTRGMKGCYIYCEDMELQTYFKEKLSRL